MSAYIAAHEAVIRLSAFVVILATVSLAEALFPARKRHFSRLRRWPANVLLTLFNTAMLRLLFPLLAVGTAAWAQAAGFGLFHALPVAPWMAFAGGFVLLDVAIYAQHWAMHRVGILWRFHRVHHTDRDVDGTTALRFHPGEVMLSMVLKMGFVVAFGIPPACVAFFEVVLNGMAMFNHANTSLPPFVERFLRALIVTPDMHRIHHSCERAEMDSNYGFNFSFWDRLFATYRPRAAGAQFPLGLPEYQSAKPNSIVFALRLPFDVGSSR